MNKLIPHCLAVLMIVSLTACENNSTTEQNSNTERTYQLVWADEFDIDGLPDSRKWNFDYGDGCPNCGWGNDEKQFYEKDKLRNIRVVDGKLIIEAHKEKRDNSEYTSARIQTKGKGDWKYGKFEIRAKLPTGRGVWPAIWMLPTNWEYGNWPKSGEIDIMEYVGFVEDSIYGTIHTEAYNHSIGTHKGQPVFVDSIGDEFHVYAVEWTANFIKWFVDGQQYFEVKNQKETFKEFPFDKEFNLILNLAIGGTWGGREGIDDMTFPKQMIVDYARIYQKAN
jgi:beta-glucanase (GH16 family)